MSKIFDRWRGEIEAYCVANGLDFQKALTMCQAFGKDSLILQYHTPSKANIVMDCSKPAPVVLSMWIENGKPVFNQTEYTQQYLK